LGEAVNRVHIPRGDLDEARLKRIRQALRAHKWVFTTSYDLLAYYAAAVEEFVGFVDYFWGPHGAFDETTIDEGRIGRRTRLLFLHGAVHLVALADGRTCKRKQTMLRGVLDQFGRPHAGDASPRPLIVTEGKSSQKKAVIEGNDYLRFALRELGDCRSPLAVFGHRLSEQDDHLIEAINKQPARPLAISMRDQGQRANRRRRHQIKSRLEDNETYFFAAHTHPLGSKWLTAPSTIRLVRLGSARRRVAGAV
jgi:Domain of unknown function (DUF4917)